MSIQSICRKTFFCCFATAPREAVQTYTFVSDAAHHLDAANNKQTPAPIVVEYANTEQMLAACEALIQNDGQNQNQTSPTNAEPALMSSKAEGKRRATIQ